MYPTIELETPRLFLKGITPEFINYVFENKTKDEIMVTFGFDESGYLHAKNMYEKGMTTHRLSLRYFLLICKQRNSPIGECGFHTWNNAHRRSELFYALKNDADKQKGFMTEALAKILEYGYTEMNLHRVEALTASWNIASQKLLAHFGFTFEGIMREDYMVDGKNEDSWCYSLLKNEWETINN